MKQQFVERLYQEAVDACVAAGINEAWLWEQKFADLVVKEAAIICERVYPEGSPLHLVSLGFGQLIREHFGVK